MAFDNEFFAWGTKLADNLFPSLSPSSPIVRQKITMSKTVRISGPRKWTYMAKNNGQVVGGVRSSSNFSFFDGGPQFFILGPFFPNFSFWDHFLCWMAWTALFWLGVAQISQGGATGHTKFQVSACFLPFWGPQGPKIDKNVH